jgi:DNA-binding FrmR family transcriptional regulator
MKSKFVLGFVMISFVLLLTSCAKVPQAELDAVKAAIEDARVTGADVYLTADFAALQDSLNAINQAVEAQKGKLFGSYKVIKTKIADLTTAAATVKGNVQIRKDEVKVECDTLMVQVTKLVGEAKGLVTKAPRGKEGAAAVAAINTEIGAVEAAVNDAAAKVAAGDLMNALNQLKSAKDQVTAITTELNDVIAKYKGKR